MLGFKLKHEKKGLKIWQRTIKVCAPTRICVGRSVCSPAVVVPPDGCLTRRGCLATVGEHTLPNAMYRSPQCLPGVATSSSTAR